MFYSYCPCSLHSLHLFLWHRPTSIPTKGTTTTGGASLVAPNIANLTVFADSNYVVVGVEFSASRRLLLANRSAVPVSEMRRELATNVIPGNTTRPFGHSFIYLPSTRSLWQSFVVVDLIIVLLFFDVDVYHPHLVTAFISAQGRYIVQHTSLALSLYPRTHCSHPPTPPRTKISPTRCTLQSDRCWPCTSMSSIAS